MDGDDSNRFPDKAPAPSAEVKAPVEADRQGTDASPTRPRSWFLHLIWTGKKIVTDAARVSLDLFRIMVPIIIVVKILNELDLIRYLAIPLEPLMMGAGLPAEMGLVLATAVLNNLYAAIIVYASLLPGLPELSAAQVSVLCLMMLIAHGLPVEARVAQRCGAGFWSQVGFRFGFGLGAGYLFHYLLAWTGYLAEPARMLFVGQAQPEGWLAWGLGQAVNLGWVFLIVVGLMVVVRILNYLRITALVTTVLGPVLRLVGIGRPAVPMTIIGLTMGIAYGGGLILHEIRTGALDRKDVLASIRFMGLSHGVIEDTLLMMLLGASVNVILWGRLAFTLLVMGMIGLVVARTAPRTDS